MNKNGPAEHSSAGLSTDIGILLVIPDKKDRYTGMNFDDSYNISFTQLYLCTRSDSIITTFVRPGTTDAAESGEFI